MEIDIFLCDAATVREGLLHVLGGGITRVGRPRYPAPLGLVLAGILKLRPAEAEEKHRIRVLVHDIDGAKMGEISGEFGVAAGPGLQPGEHLAMPIVLPMQGVPIAKPGTYSIEILLDGQQVRSLMFIAELKGPPKPPGA